MAAVDAAAGGRHIVSTSNGIDTGMGLARYQLIPAVWRKAIAPRLR
jgi:hypothetical protein